MTERDDLQSGEGSELAVPGLPETILSCTLCYVQEIDPGLKRASYDLSSGTAVRYRGSRVLDGASNGCTFFKDTLSLLEPILSAHGYEQGSASPDFRPENWIYELFFSDLAGHLEIAGGQWRCAKGELPGDTQRPQQERAGYLVLASQGDPSAESIPIRPFLHDFRGEGSASWARRRLLECELLHQNCTTPTPSLLPTRLLRIDAANDGSEICVRLHLTASSEVEVTKEKYATLSYCWGGPQGGTKNGLESYIYITIK